MTPLDALARRVEDDPRFLAHSLRLYAESERLNDDALAARLGCAAENLVMLRLCLAPGATTFRQDIATIARRHGANEQSLLTAARYGQVLVRLRSAPSGNPVTFLAARDGKDPP